mgnify:CR=1 FL=1
MAYIDGIPIKDSLHTDFSTSSGVWVEYRHQLTGDYLARKGTGESYHEFADGTFREYNKKLDDLGISGRVYLEPYDAGLGYKGDPFIHNYTGVASRQGAYSTRTVGFGGPLMRVRRGVDNGEVDVRGDVSGNISLSSPIIDYRENLVTQSETFSSWSNVNITLTAGQVDAFGGTNASIFTPDGTGTDRREILTTVVANQTYNGSVFVKAGTSDNFQVQFVDNENGYANRGLLKVDVAADGSFSTATATSILNVTYTASSNGFTRVSFSFTPSASTAQLSMRLFPDRDNGTATTIFFGAQLSNGETVEKYIKTSGSTITELDRPQETLGEYVGLDNLVPYSEEFTNSAWNKVATTVTDSNGTDPLGGTNADVITPNTSSSFHYIQDTFTVENGATYIYSIYVKANGYNFLILNAPVGNSKGNAGPIINISEGELAGSYTAEHPTTIKDCGDGWFRVSVEYTTNATSLRIDHGILPTSSVSSYVGDGTKGAIYFGAQLTKGTTIKPYQKTGGEAHYGHGYCTTWYDQFNTGSYQNNLTQATATDQPMIVSGGSLITDSSGNASLAFDGSNHYLPFDTGFTAALNISGYSAFIVFQANTTDDNQMVASLGSFSDSNKRAYLPFINGGNMTFNYGTTAAPSLTANTNLNLGIVSADIARGNMRAFLNGTDLGGGALDNKSGGDSTVALGGLGNSLLFGGKIGEFIFYQNDSLSNNMTTIQDNINDHFSIY